MMTGLTLPPLGPVSHELSLAVPGQWGRACSVALDGSNSYIPQGKGVYPLLDSVYHRSHVLTGEGLMTWGQGEKPTLQRFQPLAVAQEQKVAFPRLLNLSLVDQPPHVTPAFLVRSMESLQALPKVMRDFANRIETDPSFARIVTDQDLNLLRKVADTMERVVFGVQA
ncbi:MAG: hypothetical protein ACD_62C00154G0003 [uncultured bacterium]|nr:MAG: hypothetical protein ACD_62C00154G0003 [uncultured bacterium]